MEFPFCDNGLIDELDTDSLHTPYVETDANGWIFIDGMRLTQAEAIATAGRLAKAVEDSIWRNQKNTRWFHDSENILRRQNSKLGLAITALSKVYR